MLAQIKALREAKGKRIAGIFGQNHLAGITNLWHEYERAPYAHMHKDSQHAKHFASGLCEQYLQQWLHDATSHYQTAQSPREIFKELLTWRKN